MAGDTSSSEAPALDERVMRLIAAAINRIRYGLVAITIHDGAVTEVSATERTRISQPK